MSTTPDDLTGFVKTALAQGLPRTEIDAVLRRAGWTRSQIGEALGSFADTDFPVPVPRPRPYLDARDAFMYLLLFATLYLSAYSLGALLFGLVNAAFPDPAESYLAQGYRRSLVRWSMSSLVVAFPVFLYMSWLVGRDIADDPNKRRSKVRRWLTYMTLLAAAGVIIGDVMTLIYNLLGGELTIRVVLKVLVVAVIAGTVCWYYLTDVRREA